MEGHERQQGENYISEIHSLALKIHIWIFLSSGGLCDIVQIYLAQDSVHWPSLLKKAMNLQIL
jgi:hypothetical protein